MDPVSISGRQGQTVAGGRSSSQRGNNNHDEWTGYQWQVPLDEVCDCDSAPECCRNCYYRNKGMSKKKKFAISFAIVAVSIIITALVVRFSLGTIDVLLGIGDQRPIITEATNLSPLLCSEYSLTNVPVVQNPIQDWTQPASSSSSHSLEDPSDVDPRFDAYMLLDQPYRSYQTISYEKLESLSFPSRDYFSYWAFYLESGSEVTISLCAPQNIFIYLGIEEGRSKLNEILKSREPHGNIHHTFYPCDQSSHDWDEYHYSVTSSSVEVAFIFTTIPKIMMDVNYTIPILFSVRRKELVFDSWALYASCREVERCSLPVPNKAAAVMLEMKPNATTWPITIRTECVPSIGMYFAFFLGVPAGLMVALISCGGVLYLCQMSVMRDIERADDRRLSRTAAQQASSLNASSIGTMSRSTVTRRAFRTTTSTRAPLVDHDVLSAMAEVNMQHDLPPTYSEIEHASSPVSDHPPPSFDAPQSQDDDDAPPSYESIVT